MVTKLLKHLLLALGFTLLTLGQQYLFYYLKGMPIVWLGAGKYVGVFLFLFLATFIRQAWMRFTFLSLIFILNFFQMAHLSYFGTQILPNELYLLFSQFDEINGVLFVEYHHVLVAFLFTAIPTAIGVVLFRKNRELFSNKWIGILFCLYFIYNPVRTFVTGNTWGRQPSTHQLAGMNVYLAFSYFAGRILPHKISRGLSKPFSNASTELNLKENGDRQWDKIIFVLGESLAPSHMSLFGYTRPTTPFLNAQKNNPNFFHAVGLSGGVSTDIAVAFLLNMGFGEAGSLKAAKGTHCLFKLAKEKKYSTHFLSIQSAQQLRYIAPYLCASSLDDYQSMEGVAPETEDHQAASDRNLLRYLEKIVHFDTNQFIMLHQRGSHGPWQLRSSKEAKIFPHDNEVNYYDNSVVEFDLFMRDLSSLLKTSKKKILLVYVSDHGEGLGEGGSWGHGQLNRNSFEVPVLFMSFNKELPALTRSLPKYPTHYNLSLYLANVLGFETSQPASEVVKNYVIFGNDIDGFAGKADISFKPDGTYDFKVSF